MQNDWNTIFRSSCIHYSNISIVTIFFNQVEYINLRIEESQGHGDSHLRNVARVTDPSPSFQVVLAKWLDFFMLNRKQDLCESDIVTLHEKGKSLLTLLNEVLPERTGAIHADGSLAGWNIWKAHVVLHQAMERMMFGFTETTSAQGAESAHKVNNDKF